MKQIVLGGLACLALLQTVALADDLADIKARKEIKVGIRRSALPFGQMDHGDKPTGYDVEFAQAIGQRLGVKVVFSDVDASSAARQLDAKQIDMVAAALPRTPERERQMAFSRGYYLAVVKVLAPTNSIKKEANLKGKLVCVTRDSDLDRELPRAFPDTTPSGAQSYDDAIGKYSAGECEAVAGDEGTLRYHLSKFAKPASLAFSDFSLLLQSYAIATRKGSKTLVDAIDKALMDIEATGEADKIFSHWFSGKAFNNYYRTFHIQ